MTNASAFSRKYVTIDQQCLERDRKPVVASVRDRIPDVMALHTVALSILFMAWAVKQLLSAPVLRDLFLACTYKCELQRLGQHVAHAHTDPLRAPL